MGRKHQPPGALSAQVLRLAGSFGKHHVSWGGAAEKAVTMSATIRYRGQNTVKPDAGHVERCQRWLRERYGSRAPPK